MANPGILIALCAVFLAVDGSARPVSAVEAPAAPPCKFTLERDAAPTADTEDGETWLLTCHRVAPAVAQPMVQRRVTKLVPSAEIAVPTPSPAL